MFAANGVKFWLADRSGRVTNDASSQSCRERNDGQTGTPD